MRDRRELRSFGLVMGLIAVVSVTALVSCGGGGSDGGNDGTICQQCGDSDGFCLDTQDVTANDRPSFCFNDDGTSHDPCTVELRCLRKLDSSQRRCFPADPVTNALDLRYECDGSRPNPSVAPTTTATPSPTSTPSPSLTPSATGLTPTPTLSPTTAQTPSQGEDVDVTVTVTTTSEELPASFTATVTYPTTKGTFLASGDTQCDIDAEDGSVADDGNGTLTITFSLDPEFLPEDISVTCAFHQAAGQTLTKADLTANVTGSGLDIDIEDL